MVFVLYRPYRIAIATVIGLLCFSAQSLLARQNDGNGDDLMPSTKVQHNAETPDRQNTQHPPMPETEVDKDIKVHDRQNAQYPPLRLTSDKPEIVRLDKPAL